jgi:hypothetical protein
LLFELRPTFIHGFDKHLLNICYVLSTSLPATRKSEVNKRDGNPLIGLIYLWERMEGVYIYMCVCVFVAAESCNWSRENRGEGV